MISGYTSVSEFHGDDHKNDDHSGHYCDDHDYIDNDQFLNQIDFHDGVFTGEYRAYYKPVHQADCKIGLGGNAASGESLR